MAITVCAACGDIMYDKEERSEHAAEHKIEKRTDAEKAWGYIDGEVLS